MGCKEEACVLIEGGEAKLDTKSLWDLMLAVDGQEELALYYQTCKIFPLIATVQPFLRCSGEFCVP